MQRAPTWMPDRAGPPLVIAHRGCRDGAAENTLAAFARAREAGADGVELDVRLAADGEAVVFHDADLERLAGRRERVESMPSHRLAEVRLEGGGSIPRLSDALAATSDLLVNVEVKSPRERRRGLFSPTWQLVDAVIRAIDEAEGGARILVSSFDPVALARLRLRRPGWSAGLLFHGRQALPLRRAAAAPVLCPAALHPAEAIASAAAMARWLRRGYRVHPWTVNDPARARALAAAGASALITDEPERLRAALG